eukprot:CAMPEP_0170487714 /NCGR_PEP_ID=MMETSP0208-20121228/6460_1 /TAXON_ID=197538 /ORGANISM="Strombidium inclinatum, Strain S3" /LENGTH=113 /DNA_ID=CAMNT_0010762085 /DNA_START=3216 /DNA_END=3557 /DNA_ORIENTATION=-
MALFDGQTNTQFILIGCSVFAVTSNTIYEAKLSEGSTLKWNPVVYVPDQVEFTPLNICGNLAVLGFQGQTVRSYTLNLMTREITHHQPITREFMKPLETPVLGGKILEFNNGN